MKITASSLLRLMKCPGSAVLSRAETASVWADAGNDEHEELAHLSDLPPELAKYVPAGSRSEVKLAFDVLSRKGRIIGEGTGRDYGAESPYEIVGTTDFVGVEDDAVVCGDWKTGYMNVEPAATNPQLAFYCLAAARALGKDRAIARIIYTKTGRVDEAEFEAVDLADFANQLEALHTRVAAAQKTKNNGQAVSTNEGSWCRHCPSKAYCGSKNALLVQFASKGLAVIGDSAMTPARAAEACVEVLRAEQIVKDAKARLKTYVEDNGPIDLGDGTMYGYHHKKGDEHLDGNVAMRAIAEVIGENAKEFASIAIERSTSKAAIERAAKQFAGKRGITKMKEAVIQKIRDLGGAKHGADKRPIGVFATDKYEAAAPPDFPFDDVNRLLEKAG